MEKNMAGLSDKSLPDGSETLENTTGEIKSAPDNIRDFPDELLDDDNSGGQLATASFRNIQDSSSTPLCPTHFMTLTIPSSHQPCLCFPVSVSASAPSFLRRDIPEKTVPYGIRILPGRISAAKQESFPFLLRKSITGTSISFLCKKFPFPSGKMKTQPPKCRILIEKINRLSMTEQPTRKDH